MYQPNVIIQPTPAEAYTVYANRPIRGIFGHHTGGTTLYTPTRNGSAHKVFLPDGTIVIQVPVKHAAHGVLKTDLLYPSWLLRCPDARVSDANYCGIHYEIVYDPTPAPGGPGQVPTALQERSIKWQLEQDYREHGTLPFMPHGIVQSDKWRTEPHGLNYEACGLGRFVPNYGYLLTVPTPNDPEYVIDISDEDLKAYFESYGVGVNMATGIMQLAALSYRRDETRGPAIAWVRHDGTWISGEYNYQLQDGSDQIVIRQRFTAATAEYNPATGGKGWVELNINPEAVEGYV